MTCIKRNYTVLAASFVFLPLFLSISASELFNFSSNAHCIGKCNLFCCPSYNFVLFP